MQRWEQYLCWKTGLTAHLLLLYHHSQTLPHLISFLRHHFQGYHFELGLTCCSERVPLCLFDAIFVWKISKICTFQEAMKLQKTLAYPIKMMYLSFRDTSVLYGTI